MIKTPPVTKGVLDGVKTNKTVLNTYSEATMSKRNGITCVLFSDVPEGTHYRKGAYSWVSNSTAENYIADGYGKEYDPRKGKFVDKTKPSANSLKADIIEYLKAHDIEHISSDTKEELLKLI